MAIRPARSVAARPTPKRFAVSLPEGTRRPLACPFRMFPNDLRRSPSFFSPIVVADDFYPLTCLRAAKRHATPVEFILSACCEETRDKSISAITLDNLQRPLCAHREKERVSTTGDYRRAGFSLIFRRFLRDSAFRIRQTLQSACVAANECIRDRRSPGGRFMALNQCR